MSNTAVSASTGKRQPRKRPAPTLEEVAALDVLNAEEAAVYLRMHVAIVRQKARGGKIRHARTNDSIYGHLRFKKEWLDEYLEASAVGGEQ